jgi:hypothetical protein
MQVIGNGLALQGLPGGTVRACVPKDGGIPLCAMKYSVQVAF